MYIYSVQRWFYSKEIYKVIEKLLLDISGSPNLKLLIFTHVQSRDLKIYPCKEGSGSYAYLRDNRGEWLNS